MISCKCESTQNETPNSQYNYAFWQLWAISRNGVGWFSYWEAQLFVSYSKQQMYTLFFYKQHFYKQQKAETRQKLSTCQAKSSGSCHGFESKQQ